VSFRRFVGWGKAVTPVWQPTAKAATHPACFGRLLKGLVTLILPCMPLAAGD
jgi:hypothetical protein